jgi:transposase
MTEETSIMSNTKRVYPQEFKREALSLLESSGKSAALIERELGITPGLLSRWRRNQVAKGQPANENGPNDEKIQKLERELAVLRQEREILKKAVAIFAPGNR